MFLGKQGRSCSSLVICPGLADFPLREIIDDSCDFVLSSRALGYLVKYEAW